MICPKCKKIMLVESSMSLTSMPPVNVTNYRCFGCNITEQTRERELSPKEKWEQLNDQKTK